jgi:hypothetical protein
VKWEGVQILAQSHIKVQNVLGGVSCVLAAPRRRGRWIERAYLLNFAPESSLVGITLLNALAVSQREKDQP